jgi:predicted phosphodiesterase
MEERLKKRSEESKEYYIWRIYNIEKIPNGLTNNELRNIICEELNINVRESYLRGIAKSINQGINIQKNAMKYDKSIMVINDVHAPYERKDLLENISKHADEIQTLVIVGDFLDCHSISFFDQIRETSLKDEVLYGYNLLNKIRKILNNGQRIIMIEGNHEKRYYKNICSMNQKDLQTFINPNILEMYTEGFTLYIDGKKHKYKPIEGLTLVPHWYAVIDGIVMCHPLTFSQSKGKMLENVAQHFVSKGIDFDLAILGHTHKYSSGVTERFSNKYIIENCCMCKPQKYSDCGKTSYSPQTYGYTIVKYNNSEKITLNNCKTYLLEEEEYDFQDYSINL